jgi:hypothetical protein
MIVRLWDENVAANAKGFLKDYRNSMVGDHERDDTVVFAGLKISNSDVGASSFRIEREVTARVCTNGYRVTWGNKADNTFTKYHKGSVQAEGRIDWSPETVRSQQQTLTHEVGDVVEKFLSPEMLEADVAHLNEYGTEPIATDGAMERIGKVTAPMGVTDTDLAMIVNDFLSNNVHNRAGVAHAVTSASQRVPSAERALLMNNNVWKIAEAV